MSGFEGHGDFYGTPWERYTAHQAAKGRLPEPFVDRVQAADDWLEEAGGVDWEPPASSEPWVPEPQE